MVEQAPASVASAAPIRDAELFWFGSASPVVLAVGHSHRSALEHAIQQRLDGGIGAVLIRRDAVLPDDAYWIEAARADPDLPIALSFFGHAYNMLFLFEGVRPFRVIHPAEPAGGDDEVIALEAVRERLDTFGRASDVLRRVLDVLGGHRCVLLAPPPPNREEQIRRGLHREPGLVKLMSVHGWEVDTAPITRLSLRLAMRAIMFESFAAVAREHGMTALESPPEAGDADGALRPEYAGPDATHANGHYGALVWGQLAQHFGVSRPE